MYKSYPLQWPVGYKRSSIRTESRFKQTSEKAQTFLRDEIYRLNAKNLVISSNVNVRNDGYLYADMCNSKISDPGVAIYFRYNDKDISMCCDKYQKPWENIYALARAVEGIRMMARDGVSEFLDRAFTGFKQIAAISSFDPWFVLGIASTKDVSEIKRAYHKQAAVHHPEKGGDANRFQQLNDAYKLALKFAESSTL